MSMTASFFPKILIVALTFLGPAVEAHYVNQLKQALAEPRVLSENNLYDEIPSLVGERILLGDGGLPASELTVVVNLPAHRVRASLSVGSRWSRGIEIVRISESILKLPRYQQYGRQVGMEPFEILSGVPRESGGHLDGIVELRAEFEAFNIQVKPKGSSALALIIVDAKTVFGPECTMVTFERVDSILAQRRTFHLGLPMPGKERSEVRIITDTEVNLLAELQHRLHWPIVGAKVRVSGTLRPYQTRESMKEMQSIVARCGQ
jgi:hypothetical protein